MSRVKNIGRRRTLAAVTGLSVAVSMLAVSPADAKKKEKKSKCSITGTEGSDIITISGVFAPSGSLSYFYSNDPETVCTLGGDDAVIIDSSYSHPSGTTKINLGAGVDCANVDGNGDPEAVDGGPQSDTVSFDVGEGDSVKNVEDGGGCF